MGCFPPLVAPAICSMWRKGNFRGTRYGSPFGGYRLECECRRRTGNAELDRSDRGRFRPCRDYLSATGKSDSRPKGHTDRPDHGVDKRRGIYVLPDDGRCGGQCWTERRYAPVYPRFRRSGRCDTSGRSVGTSPAKQATAR